MYFFSQYGSKSVEIFVILRCVGIFVSGTLPVLIIMIPKFLTIKYKDAKNVRSWLKANVIDKASQDSKSKDSFMEISTALRRSLRDVSERLGTGSHKKSCRVSPYEEQSGQIPLDSTRSTPYGSRRTSFSKNDFKSCSASAKDLTPGRSSGCVSVGGLEYELRGDACEVIWEGGREGRELRAASRESRGGGEVLHDSRESKREVRDGYGGHKSEPYVLQSDIDASSEDKESGKDK